MGERPINYTLDRKNSDKNYEKENCRWATRKTQTRNRKSTKLTLELATLLVKKKINGTKTSTLALEFKIAERTVLGVVKGSRWPEARQKALEEMKS
jgi:hypothetical protein